MPAIVGTGQGLDSASVCGGVEHEESYVHDEVGGFHPQGRQGVEV